MSGESIPPPLTDSNFASTFLDWHQTTTRYLIGFIVENSALHPCDSARFALPGMSTDIFGVLCTSVVMMCTSSVVFYGLYPQENKTDQILEATRYVQEQFKKIK